MSHNGVGIGEYYAKERILTLWGFAGPSAKGLAIYGKV
jgi:hypothetical protein